ncbi:MAG: AAA family ATPase [Chloroflexi bacterium]|nr:AAA family ATPase [Chloroflexota bacterium]
MSGPIHNITIEGFKSIRRLQNFELNKELNILVGANGAGKSNFVEFFHLLHEMVEQRMVATIRKKGGADAHLFLGPKETSQINSQILFGWNGYEFSLEPTIDNSFIFGYERMYFDGAYGEESFNLGSGHEEAKLSQMYADEDDSSLKTRVARHVYPAVSSWVVYHFHDTSDTAPMLRPYTMRDNERLRSNGANLASILWHLKQKEPVIYELIRDTIRLVAPFFNDFLLRPRPSNGDLVLLLEWTQKDSDYPFHPSQLSDGTLRFMALTTALLQPNPPTTILLDEPELGLHPYALGILAGLMKQAVKRPQKSRRTQLIVATQSATLLDAFMPEDIIVVDRKNGESRFRHLTENELSIWLDEEYTLGELWQKNIYGGTPAYE